MQSVHRSLRVRGAVPALLIAGLITFQPALARAAEAKHVGVGSACALGNLVYGPAKLVLMLLGSLTAGLGYAVTAGDLDVTRKIFDSSVMGDYVLEPAHITGEKSLEFFGNPNPPPADDWSNAPAANNGF